MTVFISSSEIFPSTTISAMAESGFVS